MHGRIIRRWGVFCLALFIPAGATAANMPVIGAYFLEWGVYDRNYHVTNLPAARLTRIFYAFARPGYHASENRGALELMDAFADIEKWHFTNLPGSCVIHGLRMMR